MLPRDYNVNPNVSNPDVINTGVQYERNPDAEYGEHIANTGCICNTSASHTYGNVLAVVEKFLTDAFPADLFKTVTAATMLASRQITSVASQLRKKELPLMVLVPRIVFGQDDNRFLANTLMNSRVTNTHAMWGDGSLLQLAQDNKNGIIINGHYNRALMYVDVVLSFNTLNEQINWISYIHNMLPVGHNQYIRAPLELYIPPDFCSLISNLSHIPINDNKSVYNFLTYMNSIWDYPITYKLKGGSNNDEFFMYYLTDIDTVINDVQADQGVKDGQVKRAFNITFTMRCEFNTIGYFTLNAPNINKPIMMADTSDPAITTLFSDNIDLDDFNLPVGWIVLSWPIFKLAQGETSIQIDSVLNQSLIALIDHHLRLGIPIERFLKVQFRENGSILSDERFYIDWHTKTLHIAIPDYRRTYRLIITTNPDYVNNMIKDIYNLE